MTHDIQDLLNLIKELESRILVLEKCAVVTAVRDESSWYWDH